MIKILFSASEMTIAFDSLTTFDCKFFLGILTEQKKKQR